MTTAKIITDICEATGLTPENITSVYENGFWVPGAHGWDTRHVQIERVQTNVKPPVTDGRYYLHSQAGQPFRSHSDGIERRAVPYLELSVYDNSIAIVGRNYENLPA